MFKIGRGGILHNSSLNEPKFFSRTYLTWHAYPLEPGTALSTARTSGSPTIDPNGPGSDVPRAANKGVNRIRCHFHRYFAIPTIISNLEHPFGAGPCFTWGCGAACTAQRIRGDRSIDLRSILKHKTQSNLELFLNPILPTSRYSLVINS